MASDTNSFVNPFSYRLDRGCSCLCQSVFCQEQGCDSGVEGEFWLHLESTSGYVVPDNQDENLNGLGKVTISNLLFDILPALKDLSLPTSPPFLEAIQPSRHPGFELL